MKQICKFNTRPATINNGGHKKGHWIVWLNLQVSEMKQLTENQDEHFQAITERLVLADRSISAFLDAVDSAHIAEATTEELESILRFFQSENDVEAWKAIRKMQIQGYDNSEKVNLFYFDGLALWLDKATRVGLVNSITIEKKAKRSTTCLWFGSHSVNVNVDVALEILLQLELYAHECYNVTAQHLAQIDKCSTVEALRAFDVCADYPEILQLKNAE